MNTIESYTTATPDGGVGECSRFVIDDLMIPFTLHDIMAQGQQYTMSLWVKMGTDEPSEEGEGEVEVVAEGETSAIGKLLIRGATLPVTNDWSKHIHTFIAAKTDLEIHFGVPGVYYIYHPKLERGNTVTDWNESPLDVEDRITDAKNTADKAKEGVDDLYIKLDDSIQMLVTAMNDGTLLQQTENGWDFISGGTKDQLLAISNALNDYKDVNDRDISDLKKAVETNDNLASYVKIGELIDEATGEKHPMIEMGVYMIDDETNEGSFGEFKLRITETAIQFMQWDEPIAWINNEELHIRKAVIEEELTVGGFVLKQHGHRNNIGWIWKGVTS